MLSSIRLFPLFPYKMLGNIFRFLLQRIIRNCGVTENIFIISKDAGRPINRNPHHVPFVSYSMNIFTIYFHNYKLTTKRKTLITSLFLRHPIYRCAVHVYYEPFPRTFCDCFSSLFCFNPLCNHKN